MLEQLRASRAQPEAVLELNPEGSLQHDVHQTLEAERERAINAGERALRNALESLRCAHPFATHEGLAKARFNHASQEIKP